METIVNSSEASDGETSSSQANDVSAPTVVHVSIPSQAVQVQSVIQANQPSVIQAAGQTIQTIQVAPVAEGGDTGGDEEEESRRRREFLARRPSYRKILNDLSAETPQTLAVTKVEEESNSSDLDSENDQAANLSQVVPAHTIQIAADGTAQGLQTLTMTNVSSTTPSATPTIVQYAQGPDGQFLIPVSTLSSGNVQYQIASSSLPQGVVMATTNSSIGSPSSVPEEASRKRELRLLKNREAARECRVKKKEYVKCLENRVAVLENQNKTLIDELKALKELYCQKEAHT